MTTFNIVPFHRWWSNSLRGMWFFLFFNFFMFWICFFTHSNFYWRYPAPLLFCHYVLQFGVVLITSLRKWTIWCCMNIISLIGKSACHKIMTHSKSKSANAETLRRPLSLRPFKFTNCTNTWSHSRQYSKILKTCKSLVYTVPFKMKYKILSLWTIKSANIS